MTIFEKIKERILKLFGVTRLEENPNSDRYTFLGEADNIKRAKINENRVWYYGDSNELLNYYTAEETYGNARNPIYNRNKQQYFWGLSSQECNIKRIHSGVPNAIVTTIVNLVGQSHITSETHQELIDELKKRTNFVNLINQQQMPMTLALGWGAFKPVIDRGIDPEFPLLEWYNADCVDLIRKHDRVIGIIYKDYYTYNKQDYVLVETRRVLNGSSRIEYNLYKLGKNNEVNEVELATIPEHIDSTYPSTPEIWPAK